MSSLIYSITIMLSPTWLPPQTHLHYQGLYRGIYEYLRAPPSFVYQGRAAEYLVSLLTCYHPHDTLQQHRIVWTTAWHNALHEDQDLLLVDYQSEADTVVECD